MAPLRILLSESELKLIPSSSRLTIPMMLGIQAMLMRTKERFKEAILLITAQLLLSRMDGL